MTRLSWRWGLLAIACSIGSIHVQATPISYTISTTATGTLGSSPFTNAAITLTLTGDTSTVAPGPGTLSGFLVNPGNAKVTIAGLGTATLTGPIEVASTFNQTSYMGLPPTVVIAQLDNPAGTDGTGILWTLSQSLLGYNLQTAIGPVSGSGSVANEGPVDGFFPTSAGNLQFAAGQGGGAGTSTFTAAVTVAAAPEPGSLALVVAGIAGILGRYRCRRRSAGVRLKRGASL
jgi:hypothetical protein